MRMRLLSWTFPCALFLGVAVSASADDAKKKQEPNPPSPSQKTATVAAGERYKGSGVRRFFMGDTYRDLWSMPITVPVLNLRTHAGGLRATEAKKGNQTKSLRFKNAQGLEFAFRLVDKYKINTPKSWENTLMSKMARDQVSAQHPAGAVIADGFFTAAKVLHPAPKLVVMPDDPALGKFREEFAGQLGWIEPFPNVPEQSSWIAGAGTDNAPQRGTGWAGAFEIVGSDSLQVLLDADPQNQVDERAYLRARLTDMFLNDWDRHPGNWKWARLHPGGPWEPVSRDRDKVLVNYGGVAAFAGKMVPELVTFNATYPSMKSLTIHSLDLDRRLLCGLSAEAFDSTALFLQHQFSDSLIVHALRAMPAEFHYTIPQTAATLRERRDELRGVANQFYRYLAGYVDIHATDEADKATVTLIDQRHVDVEVRSGDQPPHFARRFDAEDTREVRLYVHGGDDNVAVLGDARPDLRVRIIGGNGHNRIIDARGPDTDHDAVRIYDAGTVDDVEYGPNKIKTENADDEPQFDRRPWVHYPGGTHIMPRDRGMKLSPIVRLDAPGDLGLVPGLGLTRTRYGFRTWPYTSRLKALGEYSTEEGWRATLGADRRFETTPWHFMATGRMSELEVLNFYGYGNDTPGGPEEFFDVDQRQWMIHPTVAYAIGTRTDITFGPVVQYSTTDSLGTYISETQPYGFGDFGQAGLRLGLYGDTRDHTRSPGRKLLLDLSATFYPAWWDVQKPYTVFNAITATYITMPIPVHPILALKAGGKKVLGDEFPFHDAAFIGGRPSDRGLPRERYAGDTSLYGTVELRVPVAQFAVLLPFDTGVYVYSDAGRVWMNNDSPGGWHTDRGVGAWIGILSPAAALSIEGDADTSALRARLGLNF